MEVEDDPLSGGLPLSSDRSCYRMRASHGGDCVNGHRPHRHSRGAKLVRAGDYSAKAAKIMALAVIEIIDLFLVATVAYITAAGLYKLFISNTQIELPTRLKINSLKDLEDKIICGSLHRTCTRSSGDWRATMISTPSPWSVSATYASIPGPTMMMTKVVAKGLKTDSTSSSP